MRKDVSCRYGRHVSQNRLRLVQLQEEDIKGANMSFVAKIVIWVILYLLVGTVINGLSRIDPDTDTYWGVLFMWPVVIILLILMCISLAISEVVKHVCERFNGDA